MIYNSFFGFNQEPFGVTPDPSFFFMSRRHEEALGNVLYGIEKRRGFVMLTGEIGSGKTTIIRYILSKLPENTRTSVILNPKVEPLDLLKMIIGDFGIASEDASMNSLMKSLNDFLLACHSRGEQAVIIVDEAQEMGYDSLEFLRLLSNFETDTSKLLQVILVGHPELRHKIASPNLTQLDQRIAVRYHLGPLDEGETAKYITHRLDVAGGIGIAFPEKGVGAIFAESKGIPRKINLFADRTLMSAYSEGSPHITVKHIEDAVGDIKSVSAVSGNAEAKASRSPRYAWMAALVLGVFLVISLGIGKKKSETREASMNQSPVIVMKTGPAAPAETDAPGTVIVGEEPEPAENTMTIVKAAPVEEQTISGADITEVVVKSLENKSPEIKTESIAFSDGVFMTDRRDLTERAALMSLLYEWGAKDVNFENVEKIIYANGLKSAELKDFSSVRKYGLPAMLLLKDGQMRKYSLLRWIIGDSAMLHDPIEGKVFVPIGELKKDILGIKLFYKNRYNSPQKADAETVIAGSINDSDPKLTP